MSLKNNIQDALKLFKIRFMNRKIPLITTLAVTLRCNANCIYCDASNLNDSEEMSLDEIKDCISSFASMGARKIGLAGGEPLLRKDIGEIVSYCKMHNLLVTMSTNGFLVPKKLDEIRYVDLLIVSLDGEEEIHDRLRGKGSHKKAIDAIEAAKEADMKVWTETVITKNNINSLDYILDKAYEMKFMTIYEPVERFLFFDDKLDDLVPSPEELRNFSLKLRNAKKNKRNVAVSNSFLDVMDKWPHYPKIKCWAGIGYGIILSDGKVIPCVEKLNHSKEFLNGREVGFKKAFYEMPDFSCEGCFRNCYNEYNAFMNLKTEAVINSLKNMK